MLEAIPFRLRNKVAFWQTVGLIAQGSQGIQMSNESFKASVQMHELAECRRSRSSDADEHAMKNAYFDCHHQKNVSCRSCLMLLKDMMNQMLLWMITATLC